MVPIKKQEEKVVRKLSAVLMIFFAISAVSAQVSDGKKIVGKWKGIYEGNNIQYTAQITIKETDGKLTGEAESTENPNGGKMPLENLEFRGNIIRFTVLSAISYEGKLNESKGIIEGVLTGMDGNPVKLDLQKEANSENVKVFEGAWAAVVDDGAVVQLILKVKEEKIEGTIAKPESGMGPIEIEKPVVEGNKISFVILDGVVTFSGVLSADKKSIEGIGNENGKEAFLLFKKEDAAATKK